LVKLGKNPGRYGLLKSLQAFFFFQGGDLFDAIASDIKYTETVARDMVTDLANALQVRFPFCKRSNIKGQCHEFMETAARGMVTDLANALQVRLLLSEVRYKRTVSRVTLP
jgi:hypothetical protein